MSDTLHGRSRIGAVILILFLALLGVLPLPRAARAAKKRAYVQKKFSQVTAGTSMSLAFPKDNAAGDMIVAYVVWDNSGAVSVTDSRGNSYASAVGPTPSSDGTFRAEVFYAPGVLGGENTVTATFAAPIGGRGELYVIEYRGVDRIAPLDVATAAAGSGPAMDSGVLTTTTANVLLFVAGASNGKTIAHVTRGYHLRARKYGDVAGENDKGAATPGDQRVTALQLGTSWTMQLVAFKPAGSTSPSTAYPLKVGPNGRTLVDQNDQPFLLIGDSPQALTVNLSEAEADAFFADREAAGFNAVWVNLLCATYTGGRPDGSTYDGIVPFTTPDDLATPNEAFFARVDHMLALAAEHGITVLLDPAETGSYLAVLLANGVAKSRNYDRYLGTRYRDVDNIVWMSGNDFQSWPNRGRRLVQAVARGIRTTTTATSHGGLDYSVSGSLDDPSWAPLIQLNASYTYYPTYAQVLADYNRPSALPTFLVEANYEFEHNAADEGTPAILRRQEYWSMLSGAAGQFYGNRYTWPFISGWESHLDTTGSLQMGYVKFLFASRRWFDLIPDQSHAVVTAGYGTFADSGALGDSDYLTAARTPDGALAMAYMPTLRTITVDMSTLGGPSYGSWYDPSNRTFVTIAGSPLANAGTRTFTPPGANADGDGDWVLVLEATGVPPDNEPPSVPTGLSPTSIGSSDVTFSWAPSTDNVAVAGYRVYRDGALVHTTPSTSYSDADLAPLTHYAFAVAAYDYANNVSDLSGPLEVTTAGAGPAFVQQSSATPQSPQSTVSTTYEEDQSAGDTNFVAIGWNDMTSSITSVTDGAATSISRRSRQLGGRLSQAIYYASSIAVAAAGTNQVTVTFDQPRSTSISAL